MDFPIWLIVGGLVGLSIGSAAILLAAIKLSGRDRER